MRLTVRATTPKGLPEGIYARGANGQLFVRAESPSNAGVWMRYATHDEIATWEAKGWDTTFNCSRPSGAGGGWMRLTEVLAA